MQETSLGEAKSVQFTQQKHGLKMSKRMVHKSTNRGLHSVEELKNQTSQVVQGFSH